MRAELRTCQAGTDSGELGGAQKGLKRAKIARKVATKMGPHQADSGLKEAMHENRLHEPELDRLERLVRAELRTCLTGTDSSELGTAQKGLKRAKMARKVATKMGPHQADSGGSQVEERK